MALTDENGGGIPATMLVSPSTMGGSPYPVYMGQNGGGSGNGFGGQGGRGGSYARGQRRDNRGRYTTGRYSSENRYSRNDGGYSRAEADMDSMIQELQEMMQELPQEKQREVQRFVQKMEQM